MAKKTVKRRPAAKAKRPGIKKPAPMKPVRKPIAKKKPAVKRIAWFSDTGHKPLISEYAQRTQAFMDAMADGKIDAGEVKAQENRLVAAMKAVEPLLDGDLHEKVTRLLCEMAAYDLMQMLHGLQQARSETTFQG